MTLPFALRAAVDRALDGAPLADLSAAAKLLSDRYRGEVRDGRAHLSEDLAARAYLAVRLPATFAAVRAALDAAAAAQPDFAPRTQLDVGAGPGTAVWAAAEVWPGLEAATLVESSPAIRRWGERLADPGPVPRMDWHAGDAAGGLDAASPADLVTAAYMINEVAEPARDALVDRLWALAAGMLVIVEPGTSAGWRRILAARARLIEAGGHILGPCPHALACPLAPPEWCHFSTRVPRSRLHRQVKGGEVGWEDEKSIWLAVSRQAPHVPDLIGRVLAPPRTGKGHLTVKLCRTDGTAGERTISRRDGDLWRTARKLDWGDPMCG